MQTRHDFRLNFVTNTSDFMTLSVPHADADASGAQISDAMLAIIDSGAVQSVRGTPQFRYSAELVRTDRREIPMA